MTARRPKSEDEDIRSGLLGEDDDEFLPGDDGDFPVELGREIEPAEEATPPGDGRFLGMTAGERAFLSVILFFNVLILGAALLVATGRVQL
ncbi:MAG: hypothetical protein MUE40_07630 [Anaerolineae bacterium]|nr:hypothetical protein [Anaerolineae bacterium]